MQYHFDEFVLSIKTAELFKGEESISIDPKIYDLLLFFCQNTQRVISREELLSQIWPTTVVSDNTLNRLIASLRKLLGDNAKSPLYIQTVPKLGYRFICDVKTEASHELTDFLPKTDIDTKRTFWPLYLVILVSICCLAYLLLPNSHQLVNESNDIETLTRIAGDKYSPQVSDNGKSLVFIGHENGRDTLWQKRLSTPKLTAVTHEFDRMFNIVQWRDNGEIVLLVRDKGIKKLIRGQVINNKLQVLGISAINIAKWWVIDIAHIADNQFAMIAKSPQHHQATLYQFDFFNPDIEHITLDMPDKSRMTRIDVNSAGDRLLILSRNLDNSTTVYQMNIANRALRQYHTFDGIVRNAIWQHNGQGILFTAMPPAQKVLALDSPDSEQPRVVASSSEYLCCDMALIENGHDIVYRTNIRNYDFKWLNDAKFAVSNSTIYDMLPSLFHRSNGVAFISKRDGAAQVYVQRDSGGAMALSNFAKYKVFSNVEVSIDDVHLVAGEANRVHLFDVEKRALVFSRTFDDRVNHVSWLNQALVAVHLADGQYQRIVLLDIKTKKILPLTTNWQRLLVDAEPDSNSLAGVYLLDRENKLYRSSIEDILAQRLPADAIAKLAIGVNRDTVISNGKLYHIPSYDTRLQVSAITKPNKLVEHIEIGDSYGFDVSNNAIIFSHLANESTELHRTK
ncbi:winged helix-turn-helix domain-containing protein [Psychrobium sp. MM17-31]|uniref:winged helix-turn-helix domain-containing protein n=1 Tax=Psychrobium sp. MM17-31 TaxID=2917758 RepID=UPI001EF458FB|nr:winged helix-turn-helix domain-containing protein [Psychrobium sp. MM17-31]MCG7530382.1 winged helix-turn-helix domain-containing protein [Psychrobium sp. MM17-31]